MKNMKKKVLSLLCSIAMLCSIAFTASAAETDPETSQNSDNSLSGSIIILHSNDVHGAIAGYAKAAALKKAFQDAGAYVLLLDAGDYIQGDPTVSISQGKNAIELMNLAGYDAATLGNHEFDYGYENMQELVKQADFPILAANVLENGSTKTDQERTIFTAPDGKKIGVFGLTTPETASKAHPAKIQGLSFLAGQDLYKCAQTQVDALQSDGCDYIICLGHLGINDESTGNRSLDLLENVEGIDVFIDGHSHSTLEEVSTAAEQTVTMMSTQGNIINAEAPTVSKPENKALLVSTGTKFANIGAIIINQDSIAGQSIPLESITLQENVSVAERAAAIQKQVDDDYGTVFAKTDVDLNGERNPGNRTEETNLGNLITDALVWSSQKNGEPVDAAIENGGGIRASIPAGDITKKDINTVLPFGNTLNIVKVTGSELLEVLEASTYSTPDEIGGFPQVSGIYYTIDTTKTYDSGDLYPGGSTYHKPNSIHRVTIQSINGKDFDQTATYTIATNDFLAAGGDTYYAFSAASVNYDLGLPLDEIVMDYIMTELNGTVTADKYGQPVGRITIQKAETPVQDPAEPVEPSTPTEPTEPELVQPTQPQPTQEPEPANPPSTEPDPAPPTSTPDPTPNPNTSNTYTVVSGDCLWKISQRVYGTGTKWELIYEANRQILRNPNVLSVGQILTIPAA